MGLGLGLALPGSSAQAGAATVDPLATAAVDLQARIDAAAPGDTLRLGAGRYTGAVVDRPLTLIGDGRGTVIAGDGRGSTLALRAPGIRVADLRVTGSGTDLSAKDSGIWVDRTAPEARITGVQVDSSGFGIWVDKAARVTIAGCVIRGRHDAAIISDLGNGIQLFNVEDTVVRDNAISRGRDGIYISNSTGCLITGNRIHGSRFAIHYMYAHRNRVVGNRTDSASVGIALMYSKGIDVRRNRVRTSRSHGMLLRSLYDSRIEANDVQSSQDGFFFSGCFRDTLTDNWIAGNRVGILVSDSPDNLVVHNAFVDNDEQLLYEDNRRIVWAGLPDGGNYWSDYVGWDRDGDGIGDRRHYPTDIASYLVSRFPVVRLVMHSPAMLLLQGLETQFPVLRPPGIVEARPLMRPPPAAHPLAAAHPIAAGRSAAAAHPLVAAPAATVAPEAL